MISTNGLNHALIPLKIIPTNVDENLKQETLAGTACRENGDECHPSSNDDR